MGPMLWPMPANCCRPGWGPFQSPPSMVAVTTCNLSSPTRPRFMGPSPTMAKALPGNWVGGHRGPIWGRRWRDHLHSDERQLLQGHVHTQAQLFWRLPTCRWLQLCQVSQHLQGLAFKGGKSLFLYKYVEDMARLCNPLQPYKALYFLWPTWWRGDRAPHGSERTMLCLAGSGHARLWSHLWPTCLLQVQCCTFPGGPAECYIYKACELDILEDRLFLPSIGLRYGMCGSETSHAQVLHMHPGQSQAQFGQAADLWYWQKPHSNAQRVHCQFFQCQNGTAAPLKMSAGQACGPYLATFEMTICSISCRLVLLHLYDLIE